MDAEIEVSAPNHDDVSEPHDPTTTPAATMYLSRVDIRNFRSLQELHVDLQPGLNVLVGRNNTGKTNLLHAVRHALGAAASRGEPIWLDRDDFYRRAADDETERTISITLTFEGLTEHQRAYFFEIVEFNLSDISKSKAIIRFEASWSKAKKNPTVKRSGGPVVSDAPEVPTHILESLPITFLPALRDAEACLAPGYRSRLATLLRDSALRRKGTDRADIEDIYRSANDDLEDQDLIKTTRESLQVTTRSLAGTDFRASAIRASEVEFDKILRTLQVKMDGGPIGGLDANGLGYNNLLYVAVVLEHLKSSGNDEIPLFLVEEPEAHLHPQLTVLLADYLATKTPGRNAPQTIVTTHSPTLAATIPPSRIHVLFTEATSGLLRCNNLLKAGMRVREEDELQRMMDVTKAALYFAKGVILVEGICEALLVPVLAKRLGYDLAQLHISVIPICGVAFRTLAKILGPETLGIPVAIITDADPPVPTSITWKDALPLEEGGRYKLSDRTKKLLEEFTSSHPTVRVEVSKLTLEYDLAEAGDRNALLMAQAWETCFDGTPGTFNTSRVAASGDDRSAKALAAWRGICRAEHTGSKAELAHSLTTRISERDEVGAYKVVFDVPAYIERAIKYVAQAVNDTAVRA